MDTKLKCVFEWPANQAPAPASQEKVSAIHPWLFFYIHLSILKYTLSPILVLNCLLNILFLIHVVKLF